MTILVDPAQSYDDLDIRKAARWLTWCHMASDESADELHNFALRIGMRRSWFHGEHYNLTAKRRRKAVAAGAVEVSARELVERNCLGVVRRKEGEG